MRKKPQEKKSSNSISHTTPVGRSVFMDLGFSAKETKRFEWENKAKMARIKKLNNK